MERWFGRVGWLDGEVVRSTDFFDEVCFGVECRVQGVGFPLFFVSPFSSSLVSRFCVFVGLCDPWKNENAGSVSIS